MAMTKRLNKQFSNEFINIEQMIPENHFLRVIDKHFDWNFIYDEVEKLILEQKKGFIESCPFFTHV